MACPIRKSLTLRSMRSVDASLTVMALIPILRAGSASGQGLGMNWKCNDLVEDLGITSFGLSSTPSDISRRSPATCTEAHPILSLRNQFQHR